MKCPAKPQEGLLRAQVMLWIGGPPPTNAHASEDTHQRDLNEALAAIWRKDMQESDPHHLFLMPPPV